jgi:GNAT superfamily N-acetyltransferase
LQANCYRLTIISFSDGITSTHRAFINRASLIILCLVPREGSLPLNIADVLFAVSNDKPCIVVVVCSSMTEAQQEIPFPTIIRCENYSPAALESIATLLFDQALSEPLQRTPATIEDPYRQTLSSQTPRVWVVEEWIEERDIPGILDIWGYCFGAPFVIDQGKLSSLLRRPGYAKHYVVRNSEEGLLGFCATFLQFVDREGENLIASLAILIVHPRYRHRGIGLSLYSHSITELRRTRGIIRLQLGSAFPRIFYGPPNNMNDEWLRRRGWHLDRRDVPGKGQIVYDLILNITEWRYSASSGSSRLVFRSCKQEDMQRVLQIVEYTSSRQARMCWYDQYWALMNGPNVKDVILALEDNEIVALALMYTPSCGSQVSTNLPWASIIGNDVGGVTCLCVSRKSSVFLSAFFCRNTRDGLASAVPSAFCFPAIL